MKTKTDINQLQTGIMKAKGREHFEEERRAKVQKVEISGKIKGWQVPLR